MTQALPRTASWRLDWSRILYDRDKISCLQSGAHGPPFAEAPKGNRAFLRWLPWNWYSIDGTGWCYDTTWDEMRLCRQVEDSVDWSGATYTDEFRITELTSSQVFAISCISCGLAARLAYGRWHRRQVERTVDEEETDTEEGEAGADASAWLRSGKAMPWNWDNTAVLALLAAWLGLLLALVLPLPALLTRSELGDDAPVDDRGRPRIAGFDVGAGAL